MRPTHTAAEIIKMHALASFAAVSPVAMHEALPYFFRDKSYDNRAINELARTQKFGSLLAHFVLKSTKYSGATFDLMALQAKLNGGGDRIAKYNGHPDQFRAIDRASTARPESMVNNSGFIGENAAVNVNLNPSGERVNLPSLWKDVPIAVIGRGAAGIMTIRTLAELGFSNITSFEKREKLGIWATENVWKGSKNNPRQLTFAGRGTLDAAPGKGETVRRFLGELDAGAQSEYRERVVRVRVKKDLGFEIFTEGRKEPRTFGIVINCLGTGKPKPLSDFERMTTDCISAIRWQEPTIAERSREELHRKRFLLVGLGNSTAEMLRVLHTFEDGGGEVDYRVLTHYPRDAIHNPNDTVVHPYTDLHYRVFRDLSKPNLTSFQGDLPQSREDYYRALYRGRILSDVSDWKVKEAKAKRKVAAFKGNGSKIEEFEVDRTYALLGYQHDAEAFREMSIAIGHDEKAPYALYDWDGEFRTASNHSVKGYFGLGVILDAPHNRNAIVIPGMMARMPDMIFSIIMRAGEYHYNSKGKN